MARIGLILFIVVAALSGGELQAQTRILAVVNGEPVTNYDVDQRMKLLRLTGQKGNTRNAALDELINEKIQDRAVKDAKIVVTDGDVDGAIASIASRAKISTAQLSGAFKQAGVSINTLRDRIRSQVGFSRLVQARFRAAATVTEQDLVAALLKDESTENVIDAPRYNLEQVTIALPPSPSPDRMRSAEARAADLRKRFSTCEAGIPLAKKTMNVVVTKVGSRMGVEFSPDVRETLDKTPVGSLTEPIRQSTGLVMLAVCSKEMVRSSNAAMKLLEPGMANERGEAFSKQYLRQLKRDAIVERRG